MRTCIVFRGENFRTKHGRSSALDNIANWKETLFNVLGPHDVVFITYPSPILSKLVKTLTPVHVSTNGYDSQQTNALHAMNWMCQNKGKYDRFLLLRFDVVYRISATHWNHWHDRGITLVNKDAHYPTLHLYADIVFVVDSPWIGHFRRAFLSPQKICLHHIGKYIEKMRHVPLHLMYDDYYHVTQHPLHVLVGEEPYPNVNDNYQGVKLLDISPWN